MEIPEVALQELKAIHLQQSGEILTDEEALEMAQNLFRLFIAVAKPFPKGLLKDQLQNFPELALLIDERNLVQ